MKAPLKSHQEFRLSLRVVVIGMLFLLVIAFILIWFWFGMQSCRIAKEWNGLRAFKMTIIF